MAENDQYTVLLIHSDTTDGSAVFVDSAIGGGAPHTITPNGDVQHDTAQQKFGAGSILFDGTGDYLSIPDSADWSFGTGDFTVDFWVRFAVLPGVGVYAFVINQRVDGNNSIQIALYNSSGTYQWNFDCYLAGAQKVISVQNTTVAIDTWYHVALVRTGNDFKWFQDGVQIGSTVTDADAIPDIAAGLEIGRWSGVGYYLNGHIDELRISKGAARWTSNFTPPVDFYGQTTIQSGVGIEAAVGTNWPEIIANLGIEALISTEQEAVVAAGLGIGAVVTTEQYATIIAGIGIEAQVVVTNWAEWIALYGTRFTARYYFTLTGTPDGVADVVIPISSFQYRLRQATPSYLQVIIPDTAWASYITARPNGEMVVEMAYLVDGVEQHREELARISLENVRADEGTKSEAITLSGHKTETYVAKIVTIQGITYQSEYNGLLRVRTSAPDMYLRPGDTVNAGAETFTCGQVIVAMSRASQWMEVVEAT